MRIALYATVLAGLVLVACQPQAPAPEAATPASDAASAETAAPTPAPAAAAPPAPAAAAAPDPDAVTVNADNFGRAETDLAFANSLKNGALGTFYHFRELTPLDKQVVVRQNRDTFDQDQYTHLVTYKPGKYNLTRAGLGTRYALVGLRILVNPNDPADVQAVHALQDQVQVSQPGGPGTFEIPKWDPISLARIRDALTVLGDSLPDKNRMFGTKAEVEPVRRLIGVATAWGGNPEKDATYLNVSPARNDGTTIYKLVVKEVPVNGFWSVTVYDSKGFFQANPQNAYSFNNLTAKKSEDGSIALQFGGCDGQIPNCLPITPGWNYIVRLYRPKPEVLNGSWKFPEPTPVSG